MRMPAMQACRQIWLPMRRASAVRDIAACPVGCMSDLAARVLVLRQQRLGLRFGQSLDLAQRP
ncbi:MAG: hypothetical protein OEW36_04405, partial [Hylemonella sp.]|nr:hypothetical protein [Hylemonella sp.]